MGQLKQIDRCMELAASSGYEVLQTFEDIGISGSAAQRPGFEAMLDFLAKRKDDNLVVLVDDLNRLARDISTLSVLREKIGASDAILQAPGNLLESDPVSHLMEKVLAVTAELEPVDD